MKKINLFLVALFVSLFSYGQTKNTTPEEMINQFFKTFETNPVKAYDDLIGTGVWASKISADDKAELHRVFNNLSDEDYIGKYYGYELITVETVLGRYTLYCYMLKYDRNAIRLNLYFYKPDKEWRCNSVAIDSDLGDELKIKARLQNLRD